MDLNLDYFQILIFSSTLSIIITSLFGFIKLRPKFPSFVNCWFCNKNTTVPYKNRNSWYCPYCEQYNGFSADGGYNKIIPAQHEPRLSRYVSVSNKHENFIRTERLCRNCTINQQLKIQQLASFVPIDEDSFEEEVEQYRIHLERAYALCPSCEGVLKDTLTRQRAWLLSLKTKEKRKSYLHGNSVYRRIMAFIGCNVQKARAASAGVCAAMVAGTLLTGNYVNVPPSLPVLLSSIPAWDVLLELLLLCHQSAALAFLGTSLQVFAALAAGTNRNYFDICAVASWLLWQLQYWIKPHLPPNFLAHAKDFELFNVVTLLATLFFSVLPFFIPRGPRTVFKKIKIDCSKRLSTSALNAATSFGEKQVTKRLTTDTDSDYAVHRFQETEFRVPLPRSTESIRENRCRKIEDLYRKNKTISSSHNNFITNKDCGTEPYFEHDLHQGFVSLSLGTSPRPHNRKWPFETRVYGCKELPGLFTTTDKRPRPVLSPPRFRLHKNVTRSPWSAGGYWQTPPPFTAFSDYSPLSRSSSHSSGFGSMSSRAAAAYDAAFSPPGSRAGSVCAGDADRFSVHSLPAYPTTYFPFYGAPYIVPHLGPYPIAPSYCFPPTPTSFSPQSSPALSDTDSSSASQRSARCSDRCKRLFDVLKENFWLSSIIISSLLLNTMATAYFVLTNNGVLTRVP